MWTYSKAYRRMAQYRVLIMLRSFLLLNALAIATFLAAGCARVDPAQWIEQKYAVDSALCENRKGENFLFVFFHEHGFRYVHLIKTGSISTESTRSIYSVDVRGANDEIIARSLAPRVLRNKTAQFGDNRYSLLEAVHEIDLTELELSEINVVLQAKVNVSRDTTVSDVDLNRDFDLELSCAIDLRNL